MKVIEHVYFCGEKEDLKALTVRYADSGDLKKVREESGCLQFEFYLSLEKPEEMLLAECWESEEHLERHHATDMMKTLRDLIGEYGLELRAEKYLVRD